MSVMQMFFTLLGVLWLCPRIWDLSASCAEPEYNSAHQSHLFKHFHKTRGLIFPSYKQNANVYITPSKGSALYFYDLDF